MLSLQYNPDTAKDSGHPVRVAIHVASLSRHLLASSLSLSFERCLFPATILVPPEIQEALGASSAGELA